MRPDSRVSPAARIVGDRRLELVGHGRDELRAQVGQARARAHGARRQHETERERGGGERGEQQRPVGAVDRRGQRRVRGAADFDRPLPARELARLIHADQQRVEEHHRKRAADEWAFSANGVNVGDAHLPLVDERQRQARGAADLHDLAGQLRKVVRAHPRNIHHEAEGAVQLLPELVAVEEPGDHLVFRPRGAHRENRKLPRDLRIGAKLPVDRTADLRVDLHDDGEPAGRAAGRRPWRRPIRADEQHDALAGGIP